MLDIPSVLYVSALFVGYMLLWAIKRRSMMRGTGTDPDVMALSTDRLQRYMAAAMKAMSLFAITLIAVHAAGPQDAWGLRRLALLDGAWFDLTGFLIGLAGLWLCRIAQSTMGAEWRVGIDESQATSLMTSGIFSLVRNPTYSGLFLVMAGFWLIWPTPMVTLFVVLFVFIIEVQVRVEEQHLLDLHGEEYERYLGRAGRYLPKVRQ